jgi:hypothetical protein
MVTIINFDKEGLSDEVSNREVFEFVFAQNTFFACGHIFL